MSAERTIGRVALAERLKLPYGERRNIVRTLKTLLSVVILLMVTVAVVAAGGRPLTADLSGANEVPPTNGDPDGTGHAALTLNQGQGEICFEINVENVEGIVAGHIHVGEAGVNGGVVVNLGVSADNLEGCVSADTATIKAIRQNPGGYYVNLHSGAHPSGAVRGQLSK